MSRYGIVYKGSKSKIAEEILEALPAGKRLVDLFGGGFAITDCALRKFPYKWERFFWNDHNPLLADLIERGIHGEFNPEKFTPTWISRDEFYKGKETDGYIKYVWSFGANGNDYLYGQDIEELKRQVFEFIVNSKRSSVCDGIELRTSSVHDRRIEWMQKAKTREQGLERLEKLEQLQNLTRLESLARLDYRDYEYQEGDVIYCDIPYADAINPTDYGGGFDHQAFMEWAKSQPAPVYYSSYTQGKVIWQKEVISVMNSADGGVYRNEALMAINAGKAPKPIKTDYQTNQVSIEDIIGGIT